jgi:selT/selW/selH-like putative selenoprotein
VSGGTGRGGSFEVTVNGKLVHSKLESGGFPDLTTLARAVAAAT